MFQSDDEDERQYGDVQVNDQEFDTRAHDVEDGMQIRDGDRHSEAGSAEGDYGELLFFIWTSILKL